METERNHAIVLGASMAGLLTARVLSSHYRSVTIVERDVLPAGIAQRKGVAQGVHAHGLLASGKAVLDRLFPGIEQEMVANGAMTGDIARDFHWHGCGDWKLTEPIGCHGIVASRPVLEGAVRDRVRSVSNITVLDNHDIQQPMYDVATSRVTGAVVRDRATSATREITAELVVDATGRGSQSPKWLASWGYGNVAESRVEMDLGYSTMTFERTPGDFRSPLGAVIAMAPPLGTRGAALISIEDNRWILTLSGTLGDYPPADEAGFIEFARTLPDPCIYDLVEGASNRSAISTYRFPANQRRHYERMKRFPGGYLVIGDAICSFNPVFGQGMSTAASEAMALDACLRENAPSLAPAFFKRARRVVENPWLISTGEDLRFPSVKGQRRPGSGLVNAYLDRVHRAATHDIAVARAFFDVLNLVEPPSSLFAPKIAWRVVRGGRRRHAAAVPASTPLQQV